MTSQDAGRRNQREETGRLLADLNALAVGSPARGPLRERLVELHLPLVEYLARRFNGRNVPHDDLVQVGSIALLKAIDRFEPARGLEFSTYATPTIVGEIKRHFRDTGWLVHVPRRAQELQSTLATVRSELSQELKRSPTVAELAERAGVSADLVLEALDVARGYAGVSLEAATDPEAGGSVGLLADERDVGLEQVELREMLRPAMRTLSERDRQILLLRFSEGKTQTEIAEAIGVSQMQVSRLIARILGDLREHLTAQEVDSEVGR